MNSSTNQKGEAVDGRRAVSRRRRSAEEKREIAEASLQSGVSVPEAAQTYGVHPSQIRRWRRLYRSGLLGNASAPALLAVRIAEDVEHHEKEPGSKPKCNPVGIIHIELARARVSIEGAADAATVRAVLESLAG